MYVVDGFEFQTKEEARQAKKESDGIRYIKDQTDMSDPDTVYKLYLRLNKPGYFFTPVGLSFLVELQEYLHTIPYIKNEDIRPIYIPEDKKAVVEVKKQTEGYKKKFHVALFFTIVLSAAIVTMFGITYVSGHSPYVVDYENELIDKYENWQNELEKREKAVEEREKALDERQDATEWTK